MKTLLIALLLLASTSATASKKISCDLDGDFWNENKLGGTVAIEFISKTRANVSAEVFEILEDGTKSPVHLGLLGTKCEVKGRVSGFDHISIYCPNKEEPLTLLFLSKDDSGELSEGVVELKRLFSSGMLEDCRAH